jgi:hypothetical protein
MQPREAEREEEARCQERSAKKQLLEGIKFLLTKRTIKEQQIERPS